MRLLLMTLPIRLLGTISVEKVKIKLDLGATSPLGCILVIRTVLSAYPVNESIDKNIAKKQRISKTRTQ